MLDSPITKAPVAIDGINEARGKRFYNDFYKSGGWSYSFLKEYRWHRRHVVKRFSLRRGMRMLEVACGSGFHTNLFHKMGFDCIGIDQSQAGIAWAQSHYPRCRYHCCDLRNMPFDPTSGFDPAGFDVILARGCSHYHYDLMSELALGTTATLMRYLKPGGVFIMVIITDLSGRREPDQVWHNTLDDYRKHFSSFGSKWSVDWVKGMAICGLYQNPTVETSD